MSKTRVTIKKPDFSALKQAVNDLTTKAGNKIVEYAVETAPVDTGNYRSEIVFDGSNEVIAQAKYSADIEYGTGAHIIEARIAKALHFKDGGNDIFVKKVHHQGTQPNPVMRNAAKKVQGEIPQLWKEAQRDNGI